MVPMQVAKAEVGSAACIARVHGRTNASLCACQDRPPAIGPLARAAIAHWANKLGQPQGQHPCRQACTLGTGMGYEQAPLHILPVWSAAQRRRSSGHAAAAWPHPGAAAQQQVFNPTSSHRAAPMAPRQERHCESAAWDTQG